ncbi:MAG TPA: flagellar biosynthesis protein FlhA [Anaeromyxobacter sp.]|nr:flagellar biosynthesis protein FlhA [Anaeromyxobacter sp.]
MANAPRSVPLPLSRAAAAAAALLARVRGAGDALFALAVLSVVLLLVAPLPPAALDALLALNLAAAAAILVVTLFARSALGFASFPTLLLLTTLFRLALNVSSTRLVLSRGDAGRVIEAFGRVVVQGNAVVGAVVFAILTLVQLLVVAKGAERVAEVAARFTLDALPGKQMAIDAELRAGALDEAGARRRRRALERESQLYGAMDGALKFVKGDAIAGIAIVLVNVVGGLVAGALRGMDLSAAARRYALLAIGDGLVSQIPALLVAVSAGIAVTRVASEDEDASLGTEIGRQLVAEPGALAAVAALCAALALAPGLPAAPFLALAGAAAAGAHRLARRGRAAEAAAPPPPAAPDAPFAPTSPVVLEVAADLLAVAQADGGRPARDGLSAVRERLWRDLGVRVPQIAIVPGALPAGGWRLLVDDVPAGTGRAPGGEAAALAPPDELALVGIACTPERDPLTGRTISLVAAADAERAARLGPVRGPLDRVLAEAAWALSRSAHQLLGVQEVQALLDALEASAPALVREASRQLPPALLADVLRRLVEEGVSIRPLRTILEALLEAGPQRGSAALAEMARRALARHIGHRCAGDGPLPALLLDPGAEAAVREGLAGEALALDPALAARLLESLAEELRGHDAPPVLLASPDVRRALRGLLAPRFPRVAVLAYEELPPELPVRPVGRLGFGAEREPATA